MCKQHRRVSRKKYSWYRQWKQTLIFTILIVIITTTLITIIITTRIITITILLLLLLPLIIIIIIIIIIRFAGLRVFRHKGKFVDSVLRQENTSQGKSQFLNHYDYCYHYVFIYFRWKCIYYAKITNITIIKINGNKKPGLLNWVSSWSHPQGREVYLNLF